eukprot:7391228-Prymnesium_polylepis.3
MTVVFLAANKFASRATMLKQIATSRDMTLKKFFGYGPRRNWEDIARRPGRRHGFTLGWSHWA